MSISFAVVVVEWVAEEEGGCTGEEDVVETEVEYLKGRKWVSMCYEGKVYGTRE